MADSARANYFYELKEALNPTIFVTEWTSHRLLNVEWSVDDDPEVVVRLCIEGIDEFLRARKPDAHVLGEILESAPYPRSTKAEYELALAQAGIIIASSDIEALAFLSIYCFLRMAFA